MKIVGKKLIWLICPICRASLNCSFEKFGKLIAELERSERLIEIEEFNLDNGLERIRSTNKEQQLKSQDITLKISTITLNKVKGKKSWMQE